MQLVWASLPLLEGPDAPLRRLWSPSGQRRTILLSLCFEWFGFVPPLRRPAWSPGLTLDLASGGASGLWPWPILAHGGTHTPTNLERWIFFFLYILLFELGL